MRRVFVVLKWIRHLFARERFERDMRTEMLAHIEQEAALQMARGLNAADAMSAAKRAFGNIPHLQEQARDSIGTRIVEETWRDVRYGVRGLLRTPGFTLVALLSLTVGIGVNTAVFSFFHYTLAGPKVTDPASYVSLSVRLTYPGWKAIVATPELFSSTVVSASTQVALARNGGNALFVKAELVSDGYFAMYDGRAALGRVFVPGETDNATGAPAAVLSNSLWRREFGGDSTVVGRTMRLTNGTVLTIVGIMPKEFRGESIRSPDFWIPLSVGALLPADRTGAAFGVSSMTDSERNWLILSARLSDGVSVAQARTRLSSVLAHLPTTDTSVAKGLNTYLRAGNESSLSSYAVITLILLATGMVLLIGCANVANLVLARGARRRREIAVRMSLGAGRVRLLRQLMMESALLSLAGALGAIAVSAVALRIVATSNWLLFIAEADDQMFAGLTAISPTIIAFTFIIAFVSATACGLLPALRSTRLDLSSATRDDGQSFGNKLARSRLRTALIAAQVALSLILLIAASLMAHSASNGQAMDLGFDRSMITTISASAVEDGYGQLQHVEFGRQLQERLNTLVGAQNIARGSIPLSGISYLLVNPQQAERKGTASAHVSPAYFGVMGIPIRRGRTFSDLEAHNGLSVALISEATAQRFWPGIEPIGQHLKLAQERYAGSKDLADHTRDVTIIGVVADAHLDDLESIPRSLVYEPSDTGSFLIRISPQKSRRLALTEIARGVDPNVLVRVRTIDQIIDENSRLMGARVTAVFSGTLGALALALSAMGIFGVVAYAVSQRTREIGVRIAIGAGQNDVMRLIILQGMRPVLIGSALGVLGGAAAARGVRIMMFGVSSVDPVAYGTAVAVVCIAAFLACYFPARKATRIDPVTALRTE